MFSAIHKEFTLSEFTLSSSKCRSATRNPSFLLFSEELFSDTRLSQQPTGGVHLHIEDWLAGVQRSSRQKKPLKMQNKPNLLNSQMNISTFSQKAYENKYDWTLGENKPNQTQFQLKNEANKPNQTHFPQYLGSSEIPIIENIWLLFLLI